MFFLLIFSVIANASPSLDAIRCLQALGKMEYGRDLHANGQPISLPYEKDGKNMAMVWDGATIRMVQAPEGYISIMPDQTDYKTVKNFDPQSAKTIWDSSLYEKNKDGRPNRSFPSSDVDRIIKEFIQLSFSTFYYLPAKSKDGRPLSNTQLRPAVAAGCQTLTTIKMVAEDHRTELKTSIGDAVASWGIHVNPLQPPDDKIKAAE